MLISIDDDKGPGSVAAGIAPAKKIQKPGFYTIPPNFCHLACLPGDRLPTKRK